MDTPERMPDSGQAWRHLALLLLIGTIGSGGMWSVVVILPAVQAEFGVARGAAALPYTLTMIGFGLGGVLMGRMADRHGIRRPVLFGGAALGIGYIAVSTSASLWQFAVLHGLLVGALGSSAMFAPLIADASLWFVRRRGIAMAIAACGNYLAGVFWPPVVEHFVSVAGWRQTELWAGVFCLVTLLPLALLLGRPPSSRAASTSARGAPLGAAALGMSPNALMAALLVAGVACCVAMSMPQVHIVAYCGDLGYGPARGATMLSLMLGCGIISRIGSGLLADRIGGIATLLIGSALQGSSLALYMAFDSLTSLYLISALFGLVQGGIVPSYAVIVREYFPASEVGMRAGLVIMATLFGMALGGWLSGVIFDLTHSYTAAFANGVAWNLLNGAIALTLLLRSRSPAITRPPARSPFSAGGRGPG